jgi:HSP20 family protein
MAMRAWVPGVHLAELQREMNRVFDSVFGKQFGGAGRWQIGYVYPPMNVTDTADHYLVRCEVPGMEMEDLEVHVAGDQLTVSGVRRAGIPEEGVTLHRREREGGKFSRAITLPGPVDGGKTDAKLADGILTVMIPKSEASKPKRVEIRAEPSGRPVHKGE